MQSPMTELANILKRDGKGPSNIKKGEMVEH